MDQPPLIEAIPPPPAWIEMRLTDHEIMRLDQNGTLFVDWPKLEEVANTGIPKYSSEMVAIAKLMIVLRDKCIPCKGPK